MTIAPPRRHIRSALCACALSAILAAEAFNSAQAQNPADWRPTPEGLRRMADYFPFETIENGADVSELPSGEPLTDRLAGLDLDAYNRENLSTGMIVLHEGQIVYEGYWQGADAGSRLNSWSIAKSVTGTLIGIAEADRSIESIEDPVVRYVPELAGTAYRDVTIEQVLQMSSGVRYEEIDEFVRLACLAFPPGPVFADCEAVRAQFGNVQGFLLSLDERAAPPGTEFQYSSMDTQVLGWVLQRATGRSPAQYLSEKIWQPLGMEDDATWILDGPAGMPLAGLSINARLRDYARFGLLMLNGGVHDGRRLLPEGWVERATTPGKAYLERLDPEVFGYQYQWWVVPDRLVVPNGGGAYEAQGTQGQFLHIDPQHALVVAMTSSWPGPTGWDVGRAMGFHATVASIVETLASD